MQLALLAVCWVINLSPAGLCVAFVIVALVPFRERVLPLLFAEPALAALDSERHHLTAAGMPTDKGRRAQARKLLPATRYETGSSNELETTDDELA